MKEIDKCDRYVSKIENPKPSQIGHCKTCKYNQGSFCNGPAIKYSATVEEGSIAFLKGFIKELEKSSVNQKEKK